MGYSLIAATSVIFLSLFIISQILMNELPIVSSNIHESLEDLKNRSIQKSNTQMKITRIESAWWNESWGYRKSFTISSSKITEDLTDFTMLIDIIDTDLRDDAQPSGNDITFVNIDNSIQMNHEIEYYNSINGHLIAWVQVPLLRSNIDTVIYMYYGNPAIGNQQNISGTWDENYVSVWHFQNDGLNDSTSNAYHGTNFSTNYNDSAKIYGGRNYNGDHRIDINDYAVISTQLTAEAWIYRDPADTQNELRILMEGTDRNKNDWGLYWRTGTTTIRFVINSNDFEEGGSFPYTGEWFYIAVTYNLGTAFLYKNGAIEVDWSNDLGSPIDNSYTTLTIGNQNNGGNDWLGNMDEVRISNISRSHAWINASFNSMNSPNTFYKIGIEELQVGTEPVPVVTIQNNGHSVIKIDEINLIINGTIASFSSSSDIVLPHQLVNLILEESLAFGTRVSIVAPDGIATYRVFGE